jgi:formylglycine-generating enzyme required for sulfatase activity
LAALSETLGDEPSPGETWTDPVTGMEFVWVPGCFDMGCGEWTDSCKSNEFPVHEVCLDGFWMGKYKVT